MDNKKDDIYYVEKIISDLSFLIKHTQDLTIEELETNEVLVDSIMFRLIQISENSDRLTAEFKAGNASIPWRAVKGMRNRIVHEYGNVDMTVVFDTVKEDIPFLLEELKSIIE